MRPARPVTCCRIWKVRSAARGSPFERPTSASMTPTSESSGKLCPLATSCVPMMMSQEPLATASSSCAQPFGTAGKIRRQDERPGFRQKFRDFFRQPLDAGTAGRQRIDIVAFRAMLRHALDMTALMADQRAAEAMFDEPGGAIRALETVAAGAAERQRRIAAPVEKKQRLFAGGQRLAHSRDERRRNPVAARRRLPAQIDSGDRRQLRAAKARGEPQMLVAALFGIDARIRSTASPRRESPPPYRSGRAPPPCRAHDRRRHRPAYRRTRAPHRQRGRRDR